MKVGWMVAVDPMEFRWIYGVSLVFGSLLREAAKTTVSTPELPQVHNGAPVVGRRWSWVMLERGLRGSHLSQFSPAAHGS